MKPLLVHVLTGFLGAGKTTLLNKALAAPELANTAVIVNEFGDVALDHLLIETGGEEVIELANGCLCCTVRGDLSDALLRLIAGENGKSIDRIIIETSGLADPLPVLQTVGALPPVERGLLPGQVISLVNAAGDPDQLVQYPEARSQISLADKILLTNTDLPEGRQNVDAVSDRLRELNAHSPVLDVHDFSFEPAHLFDGEGSFIETSVKATGHSDDHHHHGHSGAVSIIRENPVPEQTISMFCDLLLSSVDYRILRLKGVIETPEDFAHPLVVQSAGNLLYPFQRLEGWPDDKRGARIVVIGDSLDADHINRMFDAFCGLPQTDTPDRDAIANNPLAVPGMKF